MDRVTTLLLILLSWNLHAGNETRSQNETLVSIPSGIVQISKDPQIASPIFVVDKSKRFLQVWKLENDLPHMVSEYPADIGKRKGEKTKENDHRTPVGIYFLNTKKTQPEIPFELYGSRAFTTDYPNVFDRREAKGGHGIWLHAIPDKTALTRGSRGCVVVRDQVIHELENVILLKKTPLIINENVDINNLEQYKKRQTELNASIETWRAAWESEDIDSYLHFYDETFKNDKMDIKQWATHKRKIKGLYQFIKVALGHPMILMNKDQVVIRMTQKYTSDLHTDYGVKTIHAFYSPQYGFKIVREDWAPLIEAQ